MDSIVEFSAPSSSQVRQAVTEVLGCQPRKTPEGMWWDTQKREGIKSAVLQAGAGEYQTLDLVLAEVPETAVSSLKGVWDLMAKVIADSDRAVVPIACAGPSVHGRWQITARLTIAGSALTLPRLNKLSAALDLANQTAKAIQGRLPPSVAGVAPKIPSELKDMVELRPPVMNQDSGLGNVCAKIIPPLEAGLAVAMVGFPLRVRLELDRLARSMPNLALLQQPIHIQRLPQLAQTLKQAGLILAAPCGLLRPNVSVYEQGREIEATFHELAAHALPVLAFGKREELESVFGVGQGRTHNPTQPVIETLPPAEGDDLVRAALAENCVGLPASKVDQLVKMVLDAARGDARPPMEQLLQPLSNLAAKHGPDDPALATALADLAQDLSGRRDTFGTCDESPAKARSAEINDHLLQNLGGGALEDLLRAKIVGQEGALRELTERLFREAISRSETEPLRVMLAGPVGTGKSLAGRCVAKALDWPFHYIDAASFDSEHAVMSSLAGVSPGIVGSYNDGVLAKISRRPSVVEVADLDHARPSVRGSLCDFFLRILQEGTLQSGSGAIIRTLPSVIFIFTTNVAFGARKASARLGFGGERSRTEVRQEVISSAMQSLGHAFVSRVGEPILFDEFNRATAIQVAEMEIRLLVGRVTKASQVELARPVAEKIIDSLTTSETGARGIIDATRDALAEALRAGLESSVTKVWVRLEGERIVIEPAEESEKESRPYSQEREHE